jgi:hypothetical protein
VVSIVFLLKGLFNNGNIEFAFHAMQRAGGPIERSEGKKDAIHAERARELNENLRLPEKLREGQKNLAKNHYLCSKIFPVRKFTHDTSAYLTCD